MSVFRRQMSPFSHGIVLVFVLICVECYGTQRETIKHDTKKGDVSEKGKVMDTGQRVTHTTTDVFRGLFGQDVNMTELFSFLQHQEARRQLQRNAQWAYLSVVVVVLVMLGAMWGLGGLDRCRCRSDPPMTFSESQHLVSVYDVMRQTEENPLLNDDHEEWEEVMMCHRGTDP